MIRPHGLNADSALVLEEDVRLTDGQREQRLALTDKGPWTDLQPAADQSNYERRDSERDDLPKMAYRLSLQKRINELVRRLTKSRIWQVAFVSLFASSIALIWFTAEHRIILIDGVYADLATRGQLETELLNKNREWSQERMQALNDSVLSADRRRVFLDYSTLAGWLAAERDVAGSMGLTFTYSLSKTKTSRMAHVDEVAVLIGIQVPDTHDAAAYSDLMRFLREMIKTPWYVEIVDASIISSGRGAKELTAELRIWVHDEVNADD